MNREWMYRRFTSDGYISPEFQQGLESFIQFACGQPTYMDGDKIRCPCRKCKNLSYRDVDTVKLHISSKGFVFNYHVWSAQGERRIRNERPNLVGSSSSALVVVSEPDARGKRFDRHRGVSRSAVAYSYSVGSLYSVPSVCSKWEGGGSGMTLAKSDSALQAELDELRTELEASVKAREEMERRQDNHAKEQQRMMEMFEQQKEVYKQLREMLEQQQQQATGGV